MNSTAEPPRGQSADRLAALIELYAELEAFEGGRARLLHSIVARTRSMTTAGGVAVGHLHDEEVCWDAADGSLEDLIGERQPAISIAGWPGSPSTATVPSGDGTRTPSPAALVMPVYGSEGIGGCLLMTAGAGAAWTASDLRSAQLMAACAGEVYAHDDSAHPSAGVSAAPLELVSYEALLDQVTGLPGRTLLYDRLQQGIELARREDEPVAVLAAGITDFERLSRELGQGTVDAAVNEVAVRLRDTLRASDTVARSAPDRFGVVLPGANAIGGVGTAKKLIRSIAAPYDYHGQALPLEIRIGIAVYPEHGHDAGDLLAHAERALANGEDLPQAAPVQLYEDS